MAALPCVLRQVPALDQQAEFVLAAYKSGQPAALRRFEAALLLPKIESGMARMPRWAILALGCLTS